MALEQEAPLESSSSRAGRGLCADSGTARPSLITHLGSVDRHCITDPEEPKEVRTQLTSRGGGASGPQAAAPPAARRYQDAWGMLARLSRTLNELVIGLKDMDNSRVKKSQQAYPPEWDGGGPGCSQTESPATGRRRESRMFLREAWTPHSAIRAHPRSTKMVWLIVCCPSDTVSLSTPGPPKRVDSPTRCVMSPLGELEDALGHAWLQGRNDEDGLISPRSTKTPCIPRALELNCSRC